jgi:unsaturated rhamnogalacturonyl hydrolase
MIRTDARVPSSNTPTDLGGLVEHLAQVAERYPFKVWGFGESIAMEGLLGVGGTHRMQAARLLEQWAHHTPPLRHDPLAHVAPGVPLLLLYAETLDPVLIRRARELAMVLLTSPTGKCGVHIHRPDLLGWEHEAWVDCMHLDGPFLGQLALATGEATWSDMAAQLVLSHANVLQDDRTGLFSHGFDDLRGCSNGVHWGRGQGWALLGLVDTVSALPEGHSAGAEILQRLKALALGLASTETEEGTWHTVVDCPETCTESSVSAFLALGLYRALRRNLIEPEYYSLAERAWQSTISAISDTGELQGVSDATPVGPDAAHYDRRRTGVFPWGQGPALLAALELHKETRTTEERHA